MQKAEILPNDGAVSSVDQTLKPAPNDGAGSGKSILDGLFLLCEARGLFRAARRIAFAVGMRADAGELAALHDEIFVADRATVELALENFARARGVAGLRGQARARDVRGHARDAALFAKDGPSARGCGNQTSPA